jgi:hypothetical protein
MTTGLLLPKGFAVDAGDGLGVGLGFGVAFGAAMAITGSAHNTKKARSRRNETSFSRSYE